MKLTTEQIKQIIKEEIKKVLLGENLFRSNLEIMDQQQRREPQAWEQEINQYVTMLEQGLFEQFYMSIYDDLPMLAKILDMSRDFDDVKFNDMTAAQFLGSIANMEDSGQAGQLVKDYVNNRPGTPMMHMLKRRFESIELADNEMHVQFALHDIANLLRRDQVFCGYFGITNASTEYGELLITMHENNIEKNMQNIRDLWHKGSYAAYPVDDSTMANPIPGSSDTSKYSAIKYQGEKTQLVLGIG